MRINVINPNYLSDQHLLAEYREIKMLPKMLHRSINSKKGIFYHEIPKEYKLNKGHGLFFYNKLQYIYNRFDLLLSEMRHRSFETNFDVLIPDNQISFDLEQIPFVWEDWRPNKQAIKINVERILLRINEKYDWYKMEGSTWSNRKWNEYYSKMIYL